MAQIQIDTNSLKELVREAVCEALEQRRELLYDAATAVIEDIGLARAMAEVQDDEEVSLEEAMKIAGIA